MSRFSSRIGKAAHWWRLMRTAEPGSPRLQVLAAPAFRGGPSTKLEQLEGILAGKGETFGSVLALSAVTAPLALVRRLRKRGIRVLVNQNGVYYPSWAGAAFQKRNDYLRELNSLADHTFFQSEFARESYREWVGEPPAEASVLFNPVDTDRFLPSVRAAQDPVTLLLFLDFRRSYRVYWEHLLQWVQSPSFPAKDCRILAVGNCAPEEKPFFEEISARKCRFPLEALANVSRAELPAVLARADVLPHLIYNDVCPNKVLEAMASGAWVICGSAGGTRELVGKAGAVIEVQGGYGEPRLPTHPELSAALERYLADPAGCRRAARARAEEFALPGWRAEVLRWAGGNA